jgi:long-chain fatty acid transport protein
MRKPRCVCMTTVSGFIVLAGASQAQGAGFQLYEQSVSGLGTSFASTAAAEDASTVFWNPAGMAYLPGINVSAAAHVLRTSAKFNNQGSNIVLPGLTPPGGVPISGGNGGDAGVVAVIPNLYYAHAISDALRVGVGVNAPFGLTTEYDDGWVGRYHALKSDLTTININPSVAWKINDAVSIGGGLNIQYAKVDLTQAVDFSTVCLGRVFAPTLSAALAQGVPAPQAQALAAAACGGPTGFLTPGNAARDGKVTFKGDNWGYGFNLGAMFQLAPSTRLGIAYRSNVKQTLEGDATFDKPAGLPAPLASNVAFANGGIKADVNFPESVSFGVFSQIDDRWAVMGDLTWVHWKRFKELRIKFNNGAADAVTPENWDDSYKIAVGASYKLNDAWMLRAGLAFDQSPVPNEFRTPRIPDADRTWVSFGANWKVSKGGSLDFGYVHIFIGNASLNHPNSTNTATLRGNYDKSSVDILSVQYNHRF